MSARIFMAWLLQIAISMLIVMAIRWHIIFVFDVTKKERGIDYIISNNILAYVYMYSINMVIIVSISWLFRFAIKDMLGGAKFYLADTLTFIAGLAAVVVICLARNLPFD
ncbi:hypothetical protein C7477_1406 [Phyllobacterium leguminum]|uniref:Uncharacterized protein n=2 Tax=Phyllobacterium leguminum TaxID=314237 RepID=A0A318TA02_9HYPH|nr:hypothetical protein C7477_1406 [Phyllobacterium leguminum]